LRGRRDSPLRPFAHHVVIEPARLAKRSIHLEGLADLRLQQGAGFECATMWHLGSREQIRRIRMMRPGTL
jgi:hypothetical protein